MFRTIKKMFFPNPYDRMLKKCAKKGGYRILLGWNRGLGDIALGLFAMITRAKQIIPNAEITFLTRSNLVDGFSLVPGISVLVDADLKRGEKLDVRRSLQKLHRDPSEFDLIIPEPSPTDWVYWQRGNLTPRLSWNAAYDSLFEKFGLEEGFTYIGVQAVIETAYGSWRNWPVFYWEQLFSKLETFPHVRVILFGSEEKTEFTHKNLIDLRGKTTLFDMLSIIRHKCSRMILPDSGILSMAYYLDASFPLRVVSLWANANHGILKQNVPSPNPQLVHVPLVGENRDLSKVSVQDVLDAAFPVKPLQSCPHVSERLPGTLEKSGCIILAGGQGSRLGVHGPKGLFPILGKPLFQWLVEKAPESDFPIAIMTSALNHEATVKFFEEKNHFGREVYFFSQEMLPLLNEKRSSLHHLLPNGNGSIFRSFVTSGLYDVFQQKGIDFVSVIPIENPLADPADAHLLTAARDLDADVVVKCVKRESQKESMGALVEREGNVEIVEYIHLNPKMEYIYSNTGMMAIRMSFFAKMAKIDLPIHWVKKEIHELNLWALKGEKFLFDAFGFGKVSALCYERNMCYAPLKTKDSILSVQNILTFENT